MRRSSSLSCRNNMGEGAYLFESVFGADWDRLPPALKKRYAIKPDGQHAVTVEGMLNVKGSRFSRLFMPVFRLFGALVPYEGEDVPVTVRFTCTEKALHFDRTFRFAGHPPVVFSSVIEPAPGGDTVEFMRFRMGWRSHFRWTGEKLEMTHKRYVLKLFGCLIPLPTGFFIGTGYAEETPTGPDTFSMDMHLTHPLWGRVFGYKGTFKVTDA